MDARRALQLRLASKLGALDDESFGWLALALLPSAMLHGARTQVWPDGLGGFRDRERIEEIRDLANAYVKTME